MRAGLSLDLDNQWSYLKTHGDASWQSYPSYLSVVVPRALHALDRIGARITFFVVGQDAVFESNREQLASIAGNGHEIGNHSFYHEPWMHRRSAAEIDEELARAEAEITAATGRRPRGFRGPGFVRSESIVSTLVRRGYRYDASSLPTFIGPLARAYYFKSTRLSDAERAEREDLFGSFSDGFAANRPYGLTAGGGTICEIPVTTMPLFRLPIHISYVLYIATVSPALALAYFRTALFLCKITRTQPSILLHPLDFITGRECPELGFFPAMDLEWPVKERIVAEALQSLMQFDIVPLEEIACAQLREASEDTHPETLDASRESP